MVSAANRGCRYHFARYRRRLNRCRRCHERGSQPRRADGRLCLPRSRASASRTQPHAGRRCRIASARRRAAMPRRAISGGGREPCCAGSARANAPRLFIAMKIAIAACRAAASRREITLVTCHVVSCFCWPWRQNARHGAAILRGRYCIDAPKYSQYRSQLISNATTVSVRADTIMRINPSRPNGSRPDGRARVDNAIFHLP